MPSLNTYNILISRFEKFADGHDLINAFSFGQREDKDLEKEQRYPYMHVMVNDVKYPLNEAEWAFSVVIVDLVRDKTDRADNQKNVESDMHQIAEDLLSEIRNGHTLFGTECELLDNSTATFLAQFGEQAAAGVRLDFSMRFDFDYDSCSIPADYVASPDTTQRGQSVRLSAIPVYEDGVFIGNATELDFTNGATLSIDGDGKVFIDITGGGGGGTSAWGDITGNIDDQTDLATALSAKANSADLGTVATTNSYNDLDNKPSLASVATSGSYADLTSKPTIPDAQIQSDWTQASTSALDYIKNKPSIPSAQVNSDWNATSGVAQILNKPTIPSTIGDMTKAVYDTDNDGVVDFAEALKTEVRNSTGATLNKGHIVYLSGSTGNLPNAVLAQANAESTSAQTFGVVLEDIANNSNGYVVTIGQINTLDTRTSATNPFTSDTLVDGQVIYLSPTTAGHITNVKPSAPNHVVYVGYVIRTSPTNGTIQYRIQNGYELDEIHDVAISSEANDDTLVYESATSLWKNKAFSAIISFLSAVRGTELTGLSTSSPALVTATDTILQAIGKLQAQVVTPIKSNTLITHTGTLTETVIFSSNNLNGVFAANDFLELKAYIGATLNVNNKIMKVYFGPNSNNITGATQFGTYTLNSATARFQGYQRVIQFQNSLSSQLIAASTSNMLNQDTTTAVATETKTVNFATTVYMHITVTLANTADSFFLYGVKTNITR